MLIRVLKVKFYVSSIMGKLGEANRGEPRPFGAACDLGAYEYQGVVVAGQSLAGTPTITITST